MGCTIGKDSARCGLWGVSGDALRERNLLEATKTGLILV